MRARIAAPRAVTATASRPTVYPGSCRLVKVISPSTGMAAPLNEHLAGYRRFRVAWVARLRQCPLSQLTRKGSAFGAFWKTAMLDTPTVPIAGKDYATVKRAIEFISTRWRD